MLTITTAPSRKSTQWQAHETQWYQMAERLSKPIQTTVTVDEYRAMSPDAKAQIKDVGGFVGGTLDGPRRKKDAVVSRSLITLDADTPDDSFMAICELIGLQMVVYTTASHTTDHPRYRVVIPMARDVTPAEYEAIARMVAGDIGINAFDDTTYEPHRLMYWPVRHLDGPFECHNLDGEVLNPDEWLDLYDDWTDLSQWPVSSREGAIERRAGRAEDPTTKPGLVGAWCRAHSVYDLLDNELAEVYEPTGTEDRWTYRDGHTAAGAVVYDGLWLYSHHSTDPGGGQLLNAYDLMRVHRFNGDDEAMRAYAADDPATRAQLTEDRVDAAVDFDAAIEATEDDWEVSLSVGKNGEVRKTLENFVTILLNDPRLTALKYDQLRGGIVVGGGDLPWDQLAPGWSDTDFAQLQVYLEARYGLYEVNKLRAALAAATARRAYHPVRDYLDGLPEWDGVPRVDTLLVDYLGAADDAYVRAVTRKTLVAAVRRAYHPGTKFDTMLVLAGPQGCGKSTLVARLGGEWFSDALTVADMRDKVGMEKLRGFWVIEVSELAGMRKTEVEEVKSFLSRTEDSYRAAYAREVSTTQRQCVLIGTTNADDDFLRDPTGNRRFWPVAVSGEGAKAAWDMAPEEVAQIWAEAVHYEAEGEALVLTGEVADMARERQAAVTEQDDRTGMVIEYLETRLPAEWDEMDLLTRRAYLQSNSAQADFGEATLTRQRVSSIEVWSECFLRDPEAMDRRASLDIARIMKSIKGWERKASARIPIYGKQRTYMRG